MNLHINWHDSLYLGAPNVSKFVTKVPYENLNLLSLMFSCEGQDRGLRASEDI